MISAQEISRTLVSVAGGLLDEGDPIEFLHRFAEDAKALSGAVDAGILLAGEDSRLNYLAATSEDAKVMQAIAVEYDNCPCQECYRTGEPVVVPDLRQAIPRWPVFASRAVSLGFEAVHVLPLRLREQKLGALKLFLSKGQQLDGDTASLVQAVADIVTIAVVQDRNLHQANVMVEQMQGALTSRIAIEQAKGAFANHEKVSVDEAFKLLREYSRANRLKLTELCTTLLDDPETITRVVEFAQSRVLS